MSCSHLNVYNYVTRRVLLLCVHLSLSGRRVGVSARPRDPLWQRVAAEREITTIGRLSPWSSVY